MSGFIYFTGLLIWVILGAALVGFLIRRWRQKERLPTEGKRYVITGCDSGLGQQLMHRLIEQGASVYALTYSEGAAQSALAEGAQGALACDLSDSSKRQAALKWLDNVS